MSAQPTMPTRSTLADWRVPAALVALGIVPAIAGTMRVAALAAGVPATPETARFVHAPLPVLLHIVAVVPYALLGALQFAPSLRAQGARWHARVGRPLVVCGVVAAITGLWMAAFYPRPAGDAVALTYMRVGVGVYMLVALLVAVRAIVRREFRAHGAWMTRAYAIGMGAGTQVLTHLPLFILVGTPSEDARTVAMGLGWGINVVVAEVALRRAPGAAAATVHGATRMAA